MSKLYVSVSEKVTRYSRSDDDYGDWREDKDFSVTGVFLSEISTEVVSIISEVKDGDIVHVLYIRYSTGDSFGQSTGNGEVMYIFSDINAAFEAKDALSRQEQEFSVKFLDDERNVISMSNPAAGYFESLDDVIIESFVVGVGKR